MPKLNWNEINDAKDGSYERVEPNGYVCVITGMELIADKSYVRLEYDISEGEHMGYYSDDFYADKPWLHSVSLSWRTDKAMEMTKAKLKRIEESNAGFDALSAFDRDDWMKFIGKKVGIMLGEEEYEKDGTIRTGIKARGFKSVQDIREGKFKVPRKKLLNGTFESDKQASDAPSASAYDPDDIPFL